VLRERLRIRACADQRASSAGAVEEALRRWGRLASPSLIQNKRSFTGSRRERGRRGPASGAGGGGILREGALIDSRIPEQRLLAGRPVPARGRPKGRRGWTCWSCHQRLPLAVFEIKNPAADATSVTPPAGSRPTKASSDRWFVQEILVATYGRKTSGDIDGDWAAHAVETPRSRGGTWRR